MTTTVAQLWNRARDAHPALDSNSAPLSLALRRSSDFQRELIRDITSRVPSFLAVTLEVLLPLAVFDNGIPLATNITAGWLDLVRAYVVSGNNQQKIPAQFVPDEQTDQPRRWPGFTLRNNVLYLLGPVNSYSNVSKFVLTYTPLPVDFALETDAILLPDDARTAFATDLAAFYVTRLVGMPSYSIDQDGADRLQAKANASRQEFLKRIWRTSQRQRYEMRDSGPQL